MTDWRLSTDRLRNESEGKTFQDYITDYRTRSQTFRIHRFSETFGMDEELLRRIMSNKSSISDVNLYGQMDALIASIDKDKAMRFFENNGIVVPRHKLTIKLYSMIHGFIDNGGAIPGLTEDVFR